MKQKKVLIIYPSDLVPTTMMSQKRAIEQIFALQKDHQVGVLCICRTNEEAKASKIFFSEKNIQFHTVLSARKNKYINKLFSLWYILLFHLFAQRIEYNKNSSTKVIKEVLSVIKNQYDIVISHYWFGSAFMKKLEDKTITMIDAHGLVEEFIELNKNNNYLTSRPKHEKKVFKKNLRFQHQIHSFSKYLILNSKKSFELAKLNYPECKSIYCSNGQDLSYYFSYEKPPYEPKTIVFYGSLGSAQNLKAFNLFYKNVWPTVIDTEKDTKLLIIGNKPPQWIKDLNKEVNIEVTGFVEDVREHLSKACCMLIPMDVAVGFRGRIVEVMAMGIPVIGNANALDCIGLDNGINGYLTDDYSLMAKHTIDLLQDPKLRNTISENTIRFVNETYSIEATFGKLSHLIEGL
jgi:glycosyltransferase involved in cell wall biosynthesis